MRPSHQQIATKIALMITMPLLSQISRIWPAYLNYSSNNPKVKVNEKKY